MIFVDTNYFLRFLLRDVRNQHEEAKELFLNAADGKLKLTTSTIVFFEVYWVLNSYYEKSKLELLEILNKLLKLQFILLNEREILEESLKIFKKSNLSIEDCYNLSFAKSNNIKIFKTFDKKLLKEFKKASVN